MLASGGGSGTAGVVRSAIGSAADDDTRAGDAACAAGAAEDGRGNGVPAISVEEQGEQQPR